MWNLEGPRDTSDATLAWPILDDIAIVETDCAGLRLHDARYQVEQRRFPRAIGTEDAERFAVGAPQIDFVGDDDRAEGFADLFEDEAHDQAACWPRCLCS